jgi:hypothetical protein
VADLLLAVAAGAAPGPLLVLDDLRWADQPTLLLLEHLARRLGGARIRRRLVPAPQSEARALRTRGVVRWPRLGV